MTNRSKSSGVSIGLKVAWFSPSKEQNLEKNNKQGNFIVKIANTLEEREAVFRLGYQEYLKKGFINENPNEWLIRNYDVAPETATLIVKDKQNHLVGSVTLVFDFDASLPAEKIFKSEINVLRQNNEKIVELSRLVIDPQYRNSKEVLVLLFNYIYIYSYLVKKYTSLIIEVNPRHTVFYKELLHFNKIGLEKACPSVQNAPAALMYLSLQKSRMDLIKLQNNRLKLQSNRSLYQYFISINQENLVVNYLKNQVKPMSQDEKVYFGYSDSSLDRALCV